MMVCENAPGPETHSGIRIPGKSVKNNNPASEKNANNIDRQEPPITLLISFASSAVWPASVVRNRLLRVFFAGKLVFVLNSKGNSLLATTGLAPKNRLSAANRCSACALVSCLEATERRRRFSSSKPSRAAAD